MISKEKSGAPAQSIYFLKTPIKLKKCWSLKGGGLGGGAGTFRSAKFGRQSFFIARNVVGYVGLL